MLGTQAVLLRSGLLVSLRRFGTASVRELLAGVALVAPRLTLLLVHLS
jgi:hypothetical protein